MLFLVIGRRLVVVGRRIFGPQGCIHRPLGGTAGPDQPVGLQLVVALETADAVEQGAVHPGAGRSEEHTSELQSLMRISYAVFCLKKKKNTISVSGMK